MTKSKKDNVSEKKEPEKDKAVEPVAGETDGDGLPGDEKAGDGNAGGERPEAEDPDAEKPEGEKVDAEKAEAGESGDVKYLRLAADFQNYKRRMEKERFERYSEGKKDFAMDLLPILDNFDRAVAQEGEQAKDDLSGAVIEGMAMILKQFKEALEKNGVYEIEALGADFDPNMHHAVVMEPSVKYESQKVSEVLLKGYRMGEKVIRPSMVKVAE